ncbi:hypothetical protein Q7P37_004006 [Cladosporium fusiforme]
MLCGSTFTTLHNIAANSHLIATIRQSKRLKGETLPNNLDEQNDQIDKSVRADVYAERLAARPTSDDASFPRFLDLPPELRNKVYTYHLQRDLSMDLTSAVAPFIAAVNKQVRAESLSTFFAESTFIFRTGTNIGDSDIIDLFRQAGPLCPLGPHTCHHEPPKSFCARANRSGVLRGRYTKYSLPKWLSTIDDQVLLFRKIDFVIEDRRPMHERRHPWRVFIPPTSMISIRIDSGDVHISTHPPRSGTPMGTVLNYFSLGRPVGLFYHSLKWDAMVSRARATIKQMSEREGFQGLALNDLKVIAKEFRSWPTD